MSHPRLLVRTLAFLSGLVKGRPIRRRIISPWGHHHYGGMSVSRRAEDVMVDIGPTDALASRSRQTSVGRISTPHGSRRHPA